MNTRLCALLLAAATIAAAQQPPIANADLRSLAVAGGLDATIRNAVASQPGVVWFGYAVPKIPGEHNSCCFNGDVRGCGLEGQPSSSPPAATTVHLEGPAYVPVLLRYEQKTLTKVRVFSMDCGLDAGARPFFWLTGVAPAESVALLEGLVSPGSKIAESVVHAIAMHGVPQADAALEKLAVSPQESLRRQSLFWLATSRGRRGFEVVDRAAREDASEKVREHAMFALTRSKEKEAVAAIVRAAKEDRSAHVRGQALFWLGRIAADRFGSAITDAIENDPDTEVRKKAVFALSQLPADEAIPKLIRIAGSNRNLAVRKQAMFWLAQSKDPRAIAFFEQLLASR